MYSISKKILQWKVVCKYGQFTFYFVEFNFFLKLNPKGQKKSFWLLLKIKGKKTLTQFGMKFLQCSHFYFILQSRRRPWWLLVYQILKVAKRYNKRFQIACWVCNSSYGTITFSSNVCWNINLYSYKNHILAYLHKKFQKIKLKTDIIDS